MKAFEMMTKDPVTVSPTTPVSEIAAALVRHRISALPVVTKDNDVIGIVSESDLVRRTEAGTERKRGWWLEIFVDANTMAREYVKAHGLKAQDVMARPVVSVPENAELAEIANLLEAHRIKRLPVLRNGKLIGIVSRANVVKALAQMKPAEKAAPPDDGTLQKAITEKLRAASWLDSTFINITVSGRAVELWGFVGSEEQRKAIRVMAESVSGVLRVTDHIRIGAPWVAAV